MTHPHAELVARLRSEVAELLLASNETVGQGPMPPDDEKVYARKLINDALEAQARVAIAHAGDPLPRETEDAIAQAVYDSLFGLGGLQPWLEDETVTDVHAQGCDRVFVVRADGSKESAPPIADSDSDLVELIRFAAARLGRSAASFAEADAVRPAARVLRDDLALDVKTGVEFLRKQPGITKVLMLGGSGGEKKFLTKPSLISTNSSAISR